MMPPRPARKTSEVDLSAQKSSIARPVRLRPTPANAAAMPESARAFCTQRAGVESDLCAAPFPAVVSTLYTHQKRATGGRPLSSYFPSPYRRDADPKGPDATREMLRFFFEHKRHG